MQAELGKPVPFSAKAELALRKDSTIYVAGIGGWIKRMLHCNGADRGICLTKKGSRLPTGALLQESYKKAFKLGNANESRLSRCAPNTEKFDRLLWYVL
jgi:hypothetical protein